MPPKQLQWYEREFLNACGLACLYGCELTLDQFCACRGLEPEDREHLLQHFEKRSIGV